LSLARVNRSVSTKVSTRSGSLRRPPPRRLEAGERPREHLRGEVLDADLEQDQRAGVTGNEMQDGLFVVASQPMW
jgi:hypothetical protein